MTGRASGSLSRRMVRTSPGSAAAIDGGKTSAILQVDCLAFGLLAFSIVGAPLLFGSADTVSAAFWCVVLGAATAAAPTRHLARAHIAVVAAIFVFAITYAVILHEQLSPFPWWASPQPIWGEASNALGKALVPFATVARNEPWFGLGPALASLLALTCGVIVGADRTRARQLVLIFAWSGAAHALYAIIWFVVEPGMILWWDKRSYLHNLTGTFVNRNTAATYFGTCAIIWILLLSRRLRRYLPPGPVTARVLRRYVLDGRPRPLLGRLAAFFVCLMALFLTGSRAGVTFSCLMLGLAFVLFWRRDLPRVGRLKVAAGAAAIVLLVMQLMGGLVGSRFGQLGFSDEGRSETYRATLDLIADAPWFGIGIGSYSWSFPAYRSPAVSMWGVWDVAHSTPLELAAEMGIPFAVAVSLAWITGLSVLLRGMRSHRRDPLFPMLGFCIAILALMHSAIDFSLQVSGYAIVFFALFGAGLSQSLRPARTDAVEPRNALAR